MHKNEERERARKEEREKQIERERKTKCNDEGQVVLASPRGSFFLFFVQICCSFKVFKKGYIRQQ